MRAKDILRLGYRMLTGEEVPKGRKSTGNPYGWTDQFIASPAFLKTPEWKRARYDAIRLHGARCQACGRTPQRHGIVINVDHVIPRKVRPGLCLSVANLQILCSDENIGKGNRYVDDWR